MKILRAIIGSERRRPFAKSTEGAAAVEFSLTAPAYLLLLFMVAQVAIWLWTTFALQHGAEAAARCASNLPTTCNTTTAIQNYAVKHAYGLRVNASSFAVDQAAACGNRVTANVQFFEFLTKMGVKPFTATGSACYPK